MHGFKRVKKGIHDENTKKCSNENRVFLQQKEKHHSGTHKEKESYDTTFYELLNIPTLWYVVVLCAENKIWISR